MAWKIGMPSLKLNNAGVKSKNCGDFRSVAEEALKERKGHDPDIDKSRAEENRYEGYDTAAALIEYSEKHVDQLRDAKGRKLRKDAVVMCATVLKPPADMMAGLPIERQKAFLDDAYEAFVEIVGKNNVKSRADHHDELGAHTHVFWEPMTKDGRLCAKEVHNLQFFGRVNKEIPEKLRAKGWDIEDCHMYDAAKEEYEKEKDSGRSSYAFKAEAEKAKRELEAEIEDLREYLQTPADLEQIEVKKTMSGDVKLSQEDYATLRHHADRAVMAANAASEMMTGWEQMQADAEAARREVAELREQDMEVRLQMAELRKENHLLKKRLDAIKKENLALQVQLTKMTEFAAGQAGLWSKVVQHLPGMLGEGLFLRAMTKITGLQYKDIWEWQDHVSGMQQQSEQLIEQSMRLMNKTPEIDRDGR